MSNYYLYLIVLKDCPYGNNAIQLLENYNIKNFEKNTIKIHDKEKYKTELIDTFPQIYLKKKNSNGSLLLGGYSELKSFFDKFYQTPLNETYLNNFNKNWSKKATLRLIELINKY